MNNNTSGTHPRTPAIENTYEAVNPETIVEHLSVPGFMRRTPHRWSMVDMNRFGDQVGRAAEAMHIAYLTTVEAQLGVIRIFPEPLLRRVYENLSSQLGWPKVIDVGSEETRRNEDLRNMERARRHLLVTVENADKPEIAKAMGTVLDWLEGETQRMRSTRSAIAAEPEPLRAV